MLQAEKTELLSFIDSLDIKYSAEFIPFSKSRNKDNKDPSLNWKVTISKSHCSITTDYTQGVGHIPGNDNGIYNAPHKRDYEKLVAENGKYTKVLPKMSNGRTDYFEAWSLMRARLTLPAPKLIDVLYCLIIDTDVLNYANFEDWAGELGYDTDSRKGESIYKACLDIALQLRVILGNSNMDKLKDLFQDY